MNDKNVDLIVEEIFKEDKVDFKRIIGILIEM